MLEGAVFALYFVGQAVPRLQPFFTKPEYEIVNLDWWGASQPPAARITRFPIDYQFWFIRDLLLLAAVSPVLWLAMRYSSHSGNCLASCCCGAAC